MRSDRDGEHIGFDPVGLLIAPGQRLRWICEANYHTTTAYHPDNARHSLRIPRAAKPWTSDILQPGEHFDLTLTVPGVYDYFCAPHEQAGMVGRIIVGVATGPGTLPFDWFKGSAEGKDWLPVPAPAQAVFPAIADIIRRKSIRSNGLALHEMEQGMSHDLRRLAKRPLACDAAPSGDRCDGNSCWDDRAIRRARHT